MPEIALPHTLERISFSNQASLNGCYPLRVREGRGRKPGDFVLKVEPRLSLPVQNLDERVLGTLELNNGTAHIYTRTRIYSLDQSGVLSVIARNLNLRGSRVRSVLGLTHIMFSDDNQSYAYAFGGGREEVTIRETGRPAGEVLGYYNGRFIQSLSYSGRSDLFEVSEPNNPFEWDANQFASAIVSPDRITAMDGYTDLLYIGGSKSLEVWDYQIPSDELARFPFPFGRQRVIYRGVKRFFRKYGYLFVEVDGVSEGSDIHLIDGGEMGRRLNTSAVVTSNHNPFRWAFRTKDEYMHFCFGDYLFETKFGSWRDLSKQFRNIEYALECGDQTFFMDTQGNICRLQYDKISDASFVTAPVVAGGEKYVLSNFEVHIDTFRRGLSDSVEDFAPWKSGGFFRVQNEVLFGELVYEALKTGASRDFDDSFPEWQDGSTYAVGDPVGFQMKRYISNTAGISRDHSGYSEWVNDTIFNINIGVTYNGVLYFSTREGYSREKGVSVGENPETSSDSWELDTEENTRVSDVYTEYVAGTSYNRGQRVYTDVAPNLTVYQARVQIDSDAPAPGSTGGSEDSTLYWEELYTGWGAGETYNTGDRVSIYSSTTHTYSVYRNKVMKRPDEPDSGWTTHPFRDPLLSPEHWTEVTLGRPDKDSAGWKNLGRRADLSGRVEVGLEVIDHHKPGRVKRVPVKQKDFNRFLVRRLGSYRYASFLISLTGISAVSRLFINVDD